MRATSRVEYYLQALIDGNSHVPEPLSRIEELLYVLCKKGSGLPEITKADNGKYVQVVDGAYALAQIAEAEEGSY